MMSFSCKIREFVAYCHFGSVISDFGKEWNADLTDSTDSTDLFLYLCGTLRLNLRDSAWNKNPICTFDFASLCLCC